MKFRSAATMYRGCATSWEFDNVRRQRLSVTAATGIAIPTACNKSGNRAMLHAVGAATP